MPPSHSRYIDWSPTAQRAASAAARATSTSTACRQSGRAAAIGRPAASAIETTGSGAHHMPSAATAAYAPARSSGVVAETPRVNGPHSRAPWRASCASSPARKTMPSRSAISTTRSAPTRSVSHAKYVLTDSPNAVHMVCWPSIESVAFRGHQYPSQLAAPLAA